MSIAYLSIAYTKPTRGIIKKQENHLGYEVVLHVHYKHLRCADTHLGAWLGLAGEGRLLDLLEADDTTVSGGDGVVAAHVRARASNLRSACLANEDLTSIDLLATEALDAKTRPSVIVDILA